MWWQVLIILMYQVIDYRILKVLKIHIIVKNILECNTNEHFYSYSPKMVVHNKQNGANQKTYFDQGGTNDIVGVDLCGQ